MIPDPENKESMAAFEEALDTPTGGNGAVDRAIRATCMDPYCKHCNEKLHDWQHDELRKLEPAEDPPPIAQAKPDDLEAEHGVVDREEPKNVDNWKHRSQGMRCATCMYYVPKEVMESKVDGAALGRCRRHAPTMNGWPVMKPADWCGDFKLDEEKAHGNAS